MTDKNNKSAQAPPQQKNRKEKPQISRQRKWTARIIALCVAIVFAGTVSLIVEARHNSFYGEPLFEKMEQILQVKIYGLPDDPEKRARIITGIPNLLLLPPEAVLPQAPAERFRKIGTQFGFLTSDAKLGTKYVCRASDIKRIPLVALNIAIGLENLPEDLLRKVKMEYIVFCGDLQAAEGRVGGFPAPPNNTMFLNLTGRTSDREIKALFFHEFYHLFEDRFKLIKDPVWLKYFDAGYKNSYQGLMRPHNNEMGTGGFGFMNNYSRSHPYEDRAEIFSALMVSKRYLAAYILHNKDEMLAAKIEYVAATAKKHLDIDFSPIWE